MPKYNAQVLTWQVFAQIGKGVNPVIAKGAIYTYSINAFNMWIKNNST
jgi:hypothetical protein